jgi:hypothetical protein
MNLQMPFRPSARVRSEDSAKIAKAAKPALKAASVVELSEEEKALAAAVKDDEYVAGAKLWLNGQLIAVGRKYVSAGAKAAWLAGGNVPLEEDDEAEK